MRAMPSRVRYERLATERVNPRSRSLDRLGPRAIATLMNREDRRAVAAVGRVAPAIAAGGGTPCVRAALAAASVRGAATILVACNAARAEGRALLIAPAPGPEVLAGSTRLKAGTATKLVLNTLTTASMTRLGKVYGNRMVDLQPRSAKLRARAERLVAEIAGLGSARARRVLRGARGNVRVAIVMARRNLPADAAARALRAAGGSLRSVLEHPAARLR